ncbi:MAG: transglycosylase domain-containing protein [Candidatus Nucleicultricaceae bacterium]
MSSYDDDDLREEPKLFGGKPLPPIEEAPRSKKKQKDLPKQKPQKKLKQKKKLGWRIVRLLMIISIWGIFFSGLAVLWFAYDLPDINTLEISARKPGVTILDRHGKTIATYGDLHSDSVSLNELPPYVVQALLATEDRRFYHHFGVDVIGVFRAMLKNYQEGAIVQGGSTITQQLAKNFLLSEGLYTPQDRSLRRKAQEVLLALWLESNFTKDQILTIYLNRVYLGAGTYGIEAASRQYFGKHARDLSLYESAVIAGLLKAPSKYAPNAHPKQAHERARIVLSNMVKEGMISEIEEKIQALSPDSLEKIEHKKNQARYFADWIMENLKDFVSDTNQDMIIHTTLDFSLQTKAEESVKHFIDQHRTEHNLSEAALVAMTPDGGVRALVGGYDYYKSQFNRATQAKRQAGSAFKLFVFLSALEQGYRPETHVSDEYIQIGSWRPRNDTWQIRGEVTLEEAFAYSINTSAVRLIKDLGVKPVSDVAKKMGLLCPLPDNLTIALGSGETTLLELTTAYGTIANHGFAVWPYGIMLIKKPQGDVIYQREPQTPVRLLSRDVELEMLQMMQAVMTYGSGKRARLDRPCAGKTGTTQDFKDAWFVGFTPDLVTGVWMGNDDGASMKKVRGGLLPALIWHQFMEEAHKNVRVRNFPEN